IAVLGAALFMQSFTEKSRVAMAEKLAGEVWVNEATSSADYTQLPASEPYDSNNCLETNTQSCAYVRTDVPGSVPSTFNATQAADFESDGLIEKVDNKKGIYEKP
ncbi:MAG: hypothetical protein ACRDE7_09065, partial [Sphingobacterium sp.]